MSATRRFPISSACSALRAIRKESLPSASTRRIRATSFIYVASHGMVKEADAKEAYLLPVDAKLDDLDKTAYPMQELYDHSRQDRGAHHHAHARGELRQEPR